MKKNWFVLLFIVSIFQLFAQDYRDVVRFSENQVFGSARFDAMAGSFGALGADLSSSAINPAGFGRYSSSTIGMTLQQNLNQSETTFNGNSMSDALRFMKLNNAGFLFTTDISNRNTGWIYSQFGFTFNRIHTFDHDLIYSGTQFKSLLDNFADQAYGYDVNTMYSNLPFTSALAWDTYAIDPNGNGYIPLLGSSFVKHERSLYSKGAINEYNINLSGNYINRLYIGGNLGIRSAKYSENLLHREVVLEPTESLDSFEYIYRLATKGNGINVKLGAIYLPVDHIRIGLSVHSKTLYSFKDEFSADMTAYHTDTTYTIPDEWKPVGSYQYRLRSAAKAIASFAYIFGTRGCINVDLEYTNYAKGRLRGPTDDAYVSYDFQVENEDISQLLSRALNVRIGGELVFNSLFFVRGGYAYYPSAYLGVDSPTQIYGLGIGYKWKKNTVDLGLRLKQRSYSYFAFEGSETFVTQRQTGISFNLSRNF